MVTSGHDYRPLVDRVLKWSAPRDQVACVLTLPSSSSRPSARSCFQGSYFGSNQQQLI